MQFQSNTNYHHLFHIQHHFNTIHTILMYSCLHHILTFLTLWLQINLITGLSFYFTIVLLFSLMILLSVN